MADLIWVYAEVVDGKISRATLELLSKAAELGTAEAVLLGPGPDDAITTLSQHGASKVYRSDDAIYRDHPTLPGGAIEATIPALGGSYQNSATLTGSGTKLILVRPKAFEIRPRAVPATVEEVAAPR